MFAQLQISEDDNLPQSICNGCLKEIEAACDIKQKCLETDELLRNQLRHDETVQTVFIEPMFISEEEIDDSLECDINQEENDFNNVSPSYSQSQETDDEASNEISFKPGSTKKSSKPVDCPFCKKSYISLTTLKKHIGNCQKSLSGPLMNGNGRNITPRATKDYDFNCFICKLKFKFIRDKIKHLRSSHQDVRVCAVCKKKRKTANAVDSCLKAHSYGQEYLCHNCGKRFNKHSSYLKHLEIHDDKKMFACDYCGLLVKFKDNLRRHIFSTHLKIAFTCPHIDSCPHVSYTTKESLLIHMYRYHNVEAPIKCPICRDGFSYDSELKNHRKICNGRKKKRHSWGTRQIENTTRFYELRGDQFKCKLCDAVMCNRNSWKNHFQGLHKPNLVGNAGFCDLCQKSLGKNNYYRHYSTVHMKEKNFKCTWPLCTKSFSQKQTLLSHMNTHTGKITSCTCYSSSC